MSGAECPPSGETNTPGKPRRHPPQSRLTTRSVRLAPWVGKLGPRWGHKYILPHNLWRRPHRPNRSPRPAHNKHHTYALSLRNHLQCGHPLLHTRGCKVGHGRSPRTPPTRSLGNTKMPAKAEPATAQGTRDSTARLGRNIGGATADGRYEGGPGSKTPPPHHESSRCLGIGHTLRSPPRRPTIVIVSLAKTEDDPAIPIGRIAHTMAAQTQHTSRLKNASPSKSQAVWGESATTRHRDRAETCADLNDRNAKHLSDGYARVELGSAPNRLLDGWTPAER